MLSFEGVVVEDEPVKTELDSSRARKRIFAEVRESSWLHPGQAENQGDVGTYKSRAFGFVFRAKPSKGRGQFYVEPRKCQHIQHAMNLGDSAPRRNNSPG